LEKVIVSWSSGKDSALALYAVMDNPEFQVVALLTTIAEDTNQVSMHHIDRALVEQQAASIGLPLEVICFNPNDSPGNYELSMRRALSRYQHEGVTAVVSGDIFLEELRARREQNLARIDLRAIFPLWDLDTQDLLANFIRLGFKAVITSVDSVLLNRDYLGTLIDAQFSESLPEGVDPCGEQGEYHTFVFDGPIFQMPIQYTMGEVKTLENRYFYCDLLTNDT
jgi:uncharacterized protein (TIGR00290 family)